MCNIYTVTEDRDTRGSLRLVGADFFIYANDTNQGNVSGKLEVFVGGEWQSLCAQWFPGSAAHIACRELGWDGASEVITDGRLAIY